MRQVEYSVAKSLDPSQTVSELKKQPGKDIWLFAGGELFYSMHELGLVDRISVAIIPVLSVRLPIAA